MSINCSNFCLYQVDGCCNLKSRGNRQKKTGLLEYSDCPYFEKNTKFIL